MSTRIFVDNANPARTGLGDLESRWDDARSLDPGFNDQETWREHRARERDERSERRRDKPHRRGGHGCDRKRGQGLRRRID